MRLHIQRPHVLALQTMIFLSAAPANCPRLTELVRACVSDNVWGLSLWWHKLYLRFHLPVAFLSREQQ